MTQLFDDTSDVSVGGGVAETKQKKNSVALRHLISTWMNQLRRYEKRFVV